MNLYDISVTGTPPPVDEESAWAGRQIALLKENRTQAMAEVVRLESGRLTFMAPAQRMVMLLNAPARELVGVLEAKRRQAEGG